MKERERRIKSKLLKKFTGDPIVSFTTPKPNLYLRVRLKRIALRKYWEKNHVFQQLVNGLFLKMHGFKY
jgi:hypothetical protein